MRYTRLLVGIGISAAVLTACGGGGSEPAPTPPRASSSSLVLDEDSSAQGTMTGVAGEGGVLSFSVQTQPGNGVLAVTGADFTYTPNADFFGTDTFNFIVTESGRTSGAATVTLTVNGVNDAPVSSDVVLSTDEDVSLAGDVVASDVDGDTLTITIVAQPTNGLVTPGSGTAFDYDPALDFFGQDSFTFTISDGTFATQTTTVTIDVLPVNDAPVASSQALAVVAGTPVVVDITATDLENDTLTYVVTGAFSKATTNDPLTSGSLEVSPTYGTWGLDRATFVANDGQADSAPATIDLDIQVPATSSSFDVRTYDSSGIITMRGVEEGANDKLYGIGNVVGVLDPLGTSTVAQQFVAVHDASGARIKELYLGGAALQDIGSGVENGRLVAAGPEQNFPTTVRIMTLDIDDNVDVDVQRTLPYAITRDFKSFRPVHVPGVGFYFIGNDNQLTWIDYTGTVRSTVAIPSPPSTLVHFWTVDDVRVIGNLVYISGLLFECTDDGSQCDGGTGTKGYLLTADDTGMPLSAIEFPNDSSDSTILDDGRVVAHVRGSLYLINADGSIAWEQQNIGVDVGHVASVDGGDIYWWGFDRDTGISTAMRLTVDNTVVWKTDQPLALLGFLWSNDMSVDEFGNMFVSFVDRYNNVDAFGRVGNVHFDYSGTHQWTEFSEPSDMRPNSNAARSTVLTRDFRFITVAGDNFSIDIAEHDGFLFINSVTPTP